MRHDARDFLPFAPAGGGRMRNRLTLPILSAAVLVAQVDTSVVNLAMRPIGEHFAAGVSVLPWVMDSYNLVYAALLLTGGLLADLIGRRRVFMAGAALFSVASLICAVAPAISVLLAGRALTGLGAALMMPASLAILRVAWSDPVERGRALGVWTGCNGLGLAIGPTLGGALIEGFGWRGVFFVVIPLSLAAFALAPLAIAESADPHEREFDWAAQAFGALALGGLAVAAIESHRGLPAAAVAFLIAAGALVAFIRIEAGRAAALVPLPMFAIPEFRAAATATAAMTFGMYGMSFLLPLTWLSAGKLGPLAAGLALLPSAVAFVVTAHAPRRRRRGGLASISIG